MSIGDLESMTHMIISSLGIVQNADAYEDLVDYNSECGVTVFVGEARPQEGYLLNVYTYLRYFADSDHEGSGLYNVHLLLKEAESQGIEWLFIQDEED